MLLKELAGKSMSADVTMTKPFIGWFGDVEKDPDKASKIVRDGKPLLVQHTSDVTIQQKDTGIIIFDDNIVDDTEDKFEYKAYLFVTNPKECSLEQALDKEFQKTAKVDGYDGFIIKDGKNVMYAVFEMKQIWLIK